MAWKVEGVFVVGVGWGCDSICNDEMALVAE